MKPKRFEKTLTLKKETIVDLNQMNEVKGGTNDETPPDTTKGTKIMCCATGCPGNSVCVCH